MTATAKWFGPSKREKLVIDELATGPAGPAGPTGPAGSGFLPNHATAGRTSAATAGVGKVYYDTTVNKPLWSDGTNWKDAAGVTV